MAKRHPFFKSFKWEDLIDFHLEPPFKPKIEKLKPFNEYPIKFLDYLKNKEKNRIDDDESIISDYEEESEIYNELHSNWADEF